MSSTTGEADKLPSLTSAQPCHHFSLVEIQSATNDFDDQLVIGEGGFGKVYKGRLCIEETSHVVAIKRLDSMSDQGAPEFRAEIEMLSKLRHCHLVSLIGFCDDNKEMILVYAYMPHGTLYHHLHKADTPLSWVQRLKIAIGAARGLDYLHTGVGTQHGVIHRDIKSSNILLDENWSAMISDFGLSKVGPTNQSISYVDTSVKGTFGYLDPEYFYTRRLTRKTDVFAFGVVLFELLSGRRPVDISFGEEHCSLVRWAQKCVKDRKLDQMVDSNIRGTISPKCLTRFAQIAYRCVHSVPKERPSMTEVVASLQPLIELQEKHNNSAESAGIMGFTRKIHKYLVSTIKENSDQSGTSSQNSPENSTNQGFSINKDDSDLGEMPLQHEELVTREIKKFTFDELKHATRNIGNDTCLFLGDYVEVYKGWVDKTTYSPCERHAGLPITIKKIYCYKHLDLNFPKEFSHPNLVKLIGYHLETRLPNIREVWLVYEFMEDFEVLLQTGAIAQLPLVTKVKIVVGIARGLVFLHNKTRYEVREFMDQRSTVNESIDEQKILLDEDFMDYTGDSYSDNDNDYRYYDPYYDELPFQLESNISGTYPSTLTVTKSRLNRRTISLDKDFTVKLSDYNIDKLVHGQRRPRTSKDNKYIDRDYFPGCEPLKEQTNLPGFTVVFAEVLTGEKISDLTKLKKFKTMDDLVIQSGKLSMSQIAKICFQICNEVDSESKMLQILEVENVSERYI